MSNTNANTNANSNSSSRGRYQQPYRGGTVGRGRGGPGSGGTGGGRGRGRSSGDRQDGSGGPPGAIGKPGALVPVRPTGPNPASSMSWRVLYVVPPNARPEVGPSGEKLPGPFSPVLRPSTPEPLVGAAAHRTPQDVLRKQNETFAMKQRVQQLLQQAANSPSGGMGTYVGKLSQNNNPLVPVLPRLDP
ncbi:hypothetical protein GGI25_000875 [Coemansia spiralis]|uniref:Uncharacterized protein n=2 Tax=Coemansia TaxID=4863 RepID=A0A9W8GBP9_9FUNG|nr:hypothetical protein BX070DRAFT_234055 [Coemansia spiralis]KAJ1994088.1 hypothetical protein EDC05_001758 [Coemansia umbellata]KAJ2623612.1 hypothetical protein GGI26_002250 [Coemansia sp. RSA 1358]KAJ2680282.1 hypothetical protein GGI25_000875 [Coemansia spiralis]